MKNVCLGSLRGSGEDRRYNRYLGVYFSSLGKKWWELCLCGSIGEEEKDKCGIFFWLNWEYVVNGNEEWGKLGSRGFCFG